MSKNHASAFPLPLVARAAGRTSRRLQTRRSGVHGKGVFALQDLAEGETLIEYVGEVISWPEALRRHPHDPSNPQHTFYFHVDEDHVIDAKVGGNSSRWINHSCAPNCLADEVAGRVFIKALRNIHAGDELFYDYGLVIDAKYTKKLLADYPCWCGAPDCRGTLLAPKAKKADKADKPDKASQPKKADKAPKDAADLDKKNAKKAEKAKLTKKPGKSKNAQKVSKAKKVKKAKKAAED